ncbi:MAG: hypothetical protein PGN34_22095 [Methylobacterium frigidaeris]
MRAARLLARGVLAMCAGALLAASPGPGVLHGLRRVLEGRWVGDTLELRIDQDAVLANDDPSKPFQWSAFTIIDVSGPMIVFDIGPRRYVGLLDGDRLTVSISGRPGSHVLTKSHPAPGGAGGLRR